MSMNFVPKDGILIRTMTVEDYKQIEKNIYKDEPLNAPFENDPKILSDALGNKYDEYHIGAIENGTCLVAIDEVGGQIIGYVLARCQVRSELKKQLMELNAMNRGAVKTLYTILYGAAFKANVFERYGVSKLLYSIITSVNSSMRGKGIGSRLTSALMELGRAKGYSLMSATCTSFYSARQKEAMGMECVYSKAYEDFKDENGRVLYSPPAPHTHIRIMAIRL